jgi:NAD(P)-dependent dehydrogenase (short-subunit alcohol dehydrogenase family)
MSGRTSLRDLGESVVVITGASSGIGRAAALEFARCGARLVLAAPSEAPLQQSAGDCEMVGAEVIAVPTDVRDEQSVEALAMKACERHAVRPIPPLVDPDEVARGIVRCAQRPTREVTYSRAGRVLEVFHTLAPVLYARVLSPGFEAGNYQLRRARRSSGRVLSPVEDAHGGIAGTRLCAAPSAATSRRRRRGQGFAHEIFG